LAKVTKFMARIAYVNGRYLPLAHAGVSVEDRAYQFADGVYEVFALRGGALLDFEGHMARLARSLRELRIAAPMSEAALKHVICETVRRNGLSDGLVYLQVSRGAGRRDHGFPPPGTRRTLVVTVRPISWEANEARAKLGVAVITVPDLRWRRCDIKSVALLPNVLAKQEAREAGAVEAWFVDADGKVAEGASSNAWIVVEGSTLVTHALDHAILPGITRATLLRAAESLELKVVERAFTVAEALGADEAFNTGAATFVTPVVRIDGASIGSGRPGPVALTLRQAYLRLASRLFVDFFAHAKEADV
jgi:D-alanine transaminase